MRDSLMEVGSAPAEERCEQLGPNYDPQRAKAECRAFIGQLKRQFGEPPEGASFSVTSNPHDFGPYYEVAISFNGDGEAADYAYNVEGNAPTYWDDEAKAELGL